MRRATTYTLCTDCGRNYPESEFDGHACDSEGEPPVEAVDPAPPAADPTWPTGWRPHKCVRCRRVYYPLAGHECPAAARDAPPSHPLRRP